MNRLRLAICDFAGTVVDFGVMAPTLAFQKTFKKFKVPITVQEAREPMGLHKREHIKKILNTSTIATPCVRTRWQQVYKNEPTEQDIDNIFKEFVPNQLNMLHQHSTAISGAKETINYLRSQNLIIGGTTGYTREMVQVIEPYLKNQGVTFDYNVAADEVKKGRPYPYMVQTNMAKANVNNPIAVVKIGDTKDDVLEGRRANVWTIAIAESSSYVGLSEKEFNALTPDQQTKLVKVASDTLRTVEPHFIVRSIQDVPNFIDIINAQIAEGKTP
jgi:phosphonoacetaldehyde hydrolase